MNLTTQQQRLLSILDGKKLDSLCQGFTYLRQIKISDKDGGGKGSKKERGERVGEEKGKLARVS